MKSNRLPENKFFVEFFFWGARWNHLVSNSILVAIYSHRYFHFASSVFLSDATFSFASDFIHSYSVYWSWCAFIPRWDSFCWFKNVYRCSFSINMVRMAMILFHFRLIRFSYIFFTCFSTESVVQLSSVYELSIDRHHMIIVYSYLINTSIIEWILSHRHDLTCHFCSSNM